MTAYVLATLMLVSLGQVSDVPPASDGQTDSGIAVPASPQEGTVSEATAMAPTAGGSSGLPLEDPGLWLVNLARHQGHMVGRTDPRSASLHVLALLEAAEEVSPDCAEAHYWLYDLRFRMGKMKEAKASLKRYVELRPDDDAARIRYFSLALEGFQTAEDRADYVRTCLKGKNLSRTYEGELRRWLARYHYERRENEAATRELENALRLNPMDIPARELAYEMFGETEPALQRVEMALQLIAINPSQANLIWDLAEFLDGLSLHRQAQEWYNRAIDLHERSDTTSLPAEFWHRLALSYASSGDYPHAKEAADKALQTNPSFHAARLLRANIASKLGNTEESRSDVDFVLKSYESRIPEIVEQQQAESAAEVAWFFTYHHPDKERSLELATVAMNAANPSPLARLAYGYALRMNGRVDEAIRVLTPLAKTDQLAALELAKAQIDTGNRSIALTCLHKAATIRYSGIAYDLIADMLRGYDETPPATPPHTKIIATLEKFPRDVFNYHREPEAAMKFTMRFADDPVPPLGPVNVIFRLENAAPYTITFGEGFMARPLIALTARVTDKKHVSYDNYLQVLMNSRPLLLPGDAIERTVAVDVGPMRDQLIHTITSPATIELSALFDPVYRDGTLVKGTGTIAAGPLRTVRRAVSLSQETLDSLNRLAGASDVADRVLATEITASLLATAEREPKLREEAGPIIDSLYSLLATLLADHDWRVRGHAMVAAGWSKLDKRIEVAASPSVRDRNTIVMLLAVRLFAEQHGDKFKDVLRYLARKESLSPYVKTMAKSYLPETPAAQANSMIDPADAEPAATP